MAKAPTKKSPEKKPVVWYESRDPEPRAFDVAGIRPIRNFSNGRLEWEVEADDVKRFESHHFVGGGRVVRKTKAEPEAEPEKEG